MKKQKPKIIIPRQIGELWIAQGGIYAGTLRNPKTNELRHQIMHPAALPKAAWGGYGKKVEGANCYWDGAANTAAMKSSGFEHPILAELEKLNAGEFSDWVIPAQRQQNLLTCNLADHLEDCSHWTSTQFSAYDAWSQYCGYGTQIISHKGNELAARAVRSILVIQ